MVSKIAIFPSPRPDISSLELTERYIQLRAYQLYEKRGREHGRDQEDWFAAQAEIFGTKHEVGALPYERERSARAVA